MSVTNSTRLENKASQENPLKGDQREVPEDARRFRAASENLRRPQGVSENKRKINRA